MFLTGHLDACMRMLYSVIAYPETTSYPALAERKSLSEMLVLLLEPTSRL